MPALTREPAVPARLRRDSGFTLVESVVSVALFVIVASAATFAIVSAIRANDATALRVAATQIAEQRLDQLTAQGASPAVVEADTAVVADGRTYRVLVDADPGYGDDCVEGRRDISVEVTSNTVSVRLATRLACGTGER